MVVFSFFIRNFAPLKKLTYRIKRKEKTFIMRLSTLVLAASICFAPPSLNTQAKSKKKSLNLLTAKSDSTKTDYAKVTKGGKKDTGLFTVIYNNKSGKLYFELPDSAFHR